MVGFCDWPERLRTGWRSVRPSTWLMPTLVAAAVMSTLAGVPAPAPTVAAAAVPNAGSMAAAQVTEIEAPPAEQVTDGSQLGGLIQF